MSSPAAFLSSNSQQGMDSSSKLIRDAVFIDAGVEQAEVLSQGAIAGAAVYALNNQEDAIAQISP